MIELSKYKNEKRWKNLESIQFSSDPENSKRILKNSR